MAKDGVQSVAGYIRVSRIGGRSGDGYISPDEQKEAIAAYAKELDLRIPRDAWIDDQDYSGGNLERPGWESLVRRIEAGELGGVVVLRTDRFARNVPDGASQIRHIVDECDAIFASAQERMDPRTPTGRYMLQQFLNNAELQLNNLKASWRSAKERAIKRGAHIGPTPLGLSRVPKGEQRSGCLFPDKQWKPTIKALFNRAAATDEGNLLVAKWMNRHHPRPDDKQWTATTVGHVIANRVYLGEVSYRPRRDNFAPLVNTEAHAPMIDETTWLAAQRTPGVQRTNSGPINLLSGLVRCAGCRYRMSASRGGANIRVYRCGGNHGSGKCPACAVVKADRLEEWVLQQVQTQWQARFEVTIQDPADSGAAESAVKDLEESQAELRAFAADLTARRLLGDDYHPALEARVKAVEAAEATLSELTVDREQAALAEISWDSLDLKETRQVLAGALDAVYVRRGRGLAIDQRACLIWAGELDDDAPAKGRAATTLRSFEWPDNEPGSGEAAP
ncbi:MAG TPA: recombinase family protein [Solirubrobacterales bacterium]|nr:recombinase family protein [Solirubrobacterales bacterium]